MADLLRRAGKLNCNMVQIRTRRARSSRGSLNWGQLCGGKKYFSVQSGKRMTLSKFLGPDIYSLSFWSWAKSEIDTATVM